MDADPKPVLCAPVSLEGALRYPEQHGLLDQLAQIELTKLATDLDAAKVAAGSPFATEEDEAYYQEHRARYGPELFKVRWRSIQRLLSAGTVVVHARRQPYLPPEIIVGPAWLEAGYDVNEMRDICLRGGHWLRGVSIMSPPTEPVAGPAKRAAWAKAEALLIGGRAPPNGHGRLKKLAEMVQVDFPDLSVSTLSRYIGPGLRDWEREREHE